MIPKLIHYCWFGRGELPKSALECIESWKKYFPEYEIKQWNEDNYDVNKIPYISKAYNERAYAFVSDFARFDILYNHGGVYFDTDVEVIADFGELLECDSFMGQEANCLEKVFVNPGLGMGSVPGNSLYKEIIDFYSNIDIDTPDIFETTVCIYVTNLLKKYGYIDKAVGVQTIDNLKVFPPEYMCPLNYATEEIEITKNTKSVHWYSASWKNSCEVKNAEKRRYFMKKYGDKLGYRLSRLYEIPYRLYRRLNKKIK